MKHRTPFWMRSLLFILTFLFMYRSFSILLTNPFESESYLLENMINEQDSFDIAILSSSHGFCSFDPQIMEQVLPESDIHNLSIANFSIGQVSVVLQQMIEEGKTPNVVVLDMYSFNIGVRFWNQTSFYNTYSKTRQPKYIGKILSLYPLNQWPYVLSPLLYQHENWKSSKQLESNLKNFRNIDDETEKRILADLGYGHEGFRPYKEVVPLNDYLHSLNNPKEISITEDNLIGFERILSICEEYDIQLLAILAPYPKAFYAQNEDLEKLSEQYGVTIYDFNESPDEFNHFQFLDWGHMNTLGAIEGSLLLAESIATETGRELTVESMLPFQQLNLQEIEVEKSENTVQLTLIPELPQEEPWNVEWRIFDEEGNQWKNLTGQSLSFSFPSSLAINPELKLQIIYQQTGLDYPVELIFILKDFLD